MNKITKGNWYASEDTVGSIEVKTDHKDYLSIGIVTEGQNCCNNPEALANAHLIAAAPAMYAMIEILANELKSTITTLNYNIKHHSESDSDLWDMETLHLAQLLLKKARGE